MANIFLQLKFNLYWNWAEIFFVVSLTSQRLNSENLEHLFSTFNVDLWKGHKCVNFELRKYFLPKYFSQIFPLINAFDLAHSLTRAENKNEEDVKSLHC